MIYSIDLTQDKKSLVDKNFYLLVNKYKWFAHFDGFNWYAKRNIRLSSGKRTVQSMHTFIMGTKKRYEIDHINGNGLDNRIKNLRFVTHSQNLLNRDKQSNNKSGFTGVSFHKASNKYRAYGRLGGKHVHLGVYDDIMEAKLAYKKFADEHYKEFKKLK